MKRRLSVSIALIGNPKIIFLDEPSTGLDPKNRRSLWNIILKFKNKCGIVLTTHSVLIVKKNVFIMFFFFKDGRG